MEHHHGLLEPGELAVVGCVSEWLSPCHHHFLAVRMPIEVANYSFFIINDHYFFTVCVCMCVCVCMHACVFASVYVCMHMCVCDLPELLLSDPFLGAQGFFFSI